MKLFTRAAVYGIGGLVVAGALIFSGSTLGFLGPNSSGVLSVLLTDPPTVPTGVTAVYVAYSNLAVHAVGFGDGGWVTVSGGGTIDTLKLVNLSQTISSGSVPSLTYNLVAFNISSVRIDYMGNNYSATISSGRLTVPIVGDLKVNSSRAAAALVDIQPTVLNLGNQSSPSFTMAAGARALQVPSGEVSDSMRHVGNSYTLEGRAWFKSFREQHSDNLTISGLTLTPNSLSFSVTNSGSDSVTLRVVTLAPVASGGKPAEAVGNMANSFTFAVQSDGSLRLLNGPQGQINSLLEGNISFTLAAGATHHFSYSGTITSVLENHVVSVTSGAQYYVIIMGAESLSTQIVVAS